MLAQELNRQKEMKEKLHQEERAGDKQIHKVAYDQLLRQDQDRDNKLRSLRARFLGDNFADKHAMRDALNS